MITIKQKFQGPQGNIYPWREGSFDSLWDIVGLFDEALETVLMAEIGRSNELPEKPSQDKFFIHDLCEKLNDRQVLAEFHELCWKNGSFDLSEEEGRAELEDLGLSIDTVTEVYEFYDEGKLVATFKGSKD